MTSNSTSLIHINHSFLVLSKKIKKKIKVKLLLKVSGTVKGSTALQGTQTDSSFGNQG